MPISPSSGRRAPPSHFGPPTAAEQHGVGAARRGQRLGRQADRRTGRSPSRRRDGARRSARARPGASSRSASSITSGPTPSPGSAATRRCHASSSAGQVEQERPGDARPPSSLSGPLFDARRCCSSHSSRSGRAKRLLVLALVRPQGRDNPEPPVDEVDDLHVERGDLRPQAVDERILDVSAQMPTPSSASSASTSGSISIGS